MKIWKNCNNNKEQKKNKKKRENADSNIKRLSHSYSRKRGKKQRMDGELIRRERPKYSLFTTNNILIACVQIVIFIRMIQLQEKNHHHQSIKSTKMEKRREKNTYRLMKKGRNKKVLDKRMDEHENGGLKTNYMTNYFYLFYMLYFVCF